MNLPFHTTIKVKENKFTEKELHIKSALADMFASSPYLTKSQKNKELKEVFK